MIDIHQLWIMDYCCILWYPLVLTINTSTKILTYTSNIQVVVNFMDIYIINFSAKFITRVAFYFIVLLVKQYKSFLIFQESKNVTPHKTIFVDRHLILLQIVTFLQCLFYHRCFHPSF